MHIDIHALGGIRTHDPSFRASEYSSCLRPRDHSDRRIKFWGDINLILRVDNIDWWKMGIKSTSGVSTYCPPRGN
jgi:hypothetical protein